MNCRVVVEAAVPVFDVETEDEAIRIAISKTGEMLNPDLNYVEINMGERTSPSGEELPPAFIAADEALVALELEMTVFNVEREEHASRIARKEIGQLLENIPLDVLEVEVIEESDDDDTGGDDDIDGDDESENDIKESEDTVENIESDIEDIGTEGETDSESDTDDGGGQAEITDGDAQTDEERTNDEDVLPEFEDLLE